MTNYFSKSTGIDKDISRHSKEEAKLRGYIYEESKESDGELFKLAYTSALEALLKSKAEIVNKIGRNNK